MKQLIFLIGVLLIGCSKPIEMECENKTITINNTIKEIIEKEIIIYKNITIPCNKTQYEYRGNTTRELELIRRIGFLESQQDKFINHSDCFDELNKTNNKLEDCEDEQNE